MEQHLPARQESDPQPGHAEDVDEQPVFQQDVSVAFMPLALITFLILAFAAAAWTVLAVG